MNESQEQIYLKIDGQEYGPYSESQVHQMLRDGQIATDIEGKWSELLGWRLLHDSEKFRASIPREAAPEPVTAKRYSYKHQETMLDGQKSLIAGIWLTCIYLCAFVAVVFPPWTASFWIPFFIGLLTIGLICATTLTYYNNFFSRNWAISATVIFLMLSSGSSWLGNNAYTRGTLELGSQKGANFGKRALWPNRSSDTSGKIEGSQKGALSRKKALREKRQKSSEKFTFSRAYILRAIPYKASFFSLLKFSPFLVFLVFTVKGINSSYANSSKTGMIVHASLTLICLASLGWLFSAGRMDFLGIWVAIILGGMFMGGRLFGHDKYTVLWQVFFAFTGIFLVILGLFMLIAGDYIFFGRQP